MNWPKDVVEMVTTPPSVKVATQEGELAELPKFLLLLAGALHGPAGEALAVESPVVIAPEVSKPGRPVGRYYRPLVDNRPFCLNGRYFIKIV